MNQQDIQSLTEFSAACGTSQLIIQQRGVEVFRHESSADPVDVYAVQKGVLALLISLAEEKYLLEICDAINHHLDPEWTGLSPWHEASLTIETLLAMTTGMDDDLNPLGKVGESWRYNNTAYQYLKKILCLHTGLSLDALSRNWLFEPLKMTDTRWVDRSEKLPDGTAYTGLLSTANDLVKLGQLVLERGQIDGAPFIPEFFIDQMSQPGSKENPAWGLSWWNNNQQKYINPMRSKIHDGPLIPGAPSDLIAARGMFENYLYVVPSLNLVVARTAVPPHPDSDQPRFERQFWRLLTQALK